MNKTRLKSGAVVARLFVLVAASLLIGAMHAHAQQITVRSAVVAAIFFVKVL